LQALRQSGIRASTHPPADHHVVVVFAPDRVLANGPRLCGLPACTGGRNSTADEHGDQADRNNADNAEDDDDTGLLLGPVLALGDVGDCLAGEESGVDGRHVGV